MARKPKRMSRKELRQPDEVQVKLKGMWDWIEAHWQWLVAAAVGLLVLGGLSSFLSSRAEAQRQEAAAAIAKAIYPVFAPIGVAADDPTVPARLKDGETFVDRAAALAEAARRLDELVTAGDAPAAVAYLRATLPLGEPAATAKALDAWIGQHAENPLLPAARLRHADALVRAGDRAGALAAYQAVADASAGRLKALALMGVGDLQNPLVYEGGDTAAAKAAYEEALATLGPRPEAGPGDLLLASFGTPYLHAELDQKLALLK